MWPDPENSSALLRIRIILLLWRLQGCRLRGGAMVVDVNMDDGMLDAVAEMREFLNRLVAEPEVARLPVMIDSSRWEVQKAALEVLPGKSVWSIRFLLKRARSIFCGKHGRFANMVLLWWLWLLMSLGKPILLSGGWRFAAGPTGCLLKKAGYGAEDIIFDTNIFR